MSLNLLNGILYFIHAIGAIVFGCAFLFFLFCIPEILKGEFTKKDIKFFLISIILAFIFTGSFIAMMIGYDNAPWVTDKDPHSIERIASLNDSNMMNGRIYMRRGYINEDLYYQYMVKLNNGGFKANKVRSSGATLYYADDNYRVEWYTMRKQYWYLSEEKNCWKIYIPEGSISDDYLIDLN